MPEQLSKRIVFVDYAKAICIFLMVVGHYCDNRLLITYIYSFHMPALFIVSGYLYKPRAWWKTALSLLVPIVFFSIVNLVVCLLLGKMTLCDDVIFPQILFRIIRYRYGLGESLLIGDWFLWALLGLRFLFGDIDVLRTLRKHYVPIVVVCTAYMTFESHFVSIDTLFRGYLIGRMIPSLVFFATGFLLKDTRWNPQSISNRAIVLFMLAYIPLPMLNRAGGIVSNDFGISYLAFVVIAVLGSVILFVLTSKLSPSKFIETISTGTLVVLGMHMPLLHVLSYLLPGSFFVMFPFITIVICYYITILCEKYCPVLLGKWK